MKKLVRVMRDPCVGCSGSGRKSQHVLCLDCAGRGFTRIRCGQCWKWQAVGEFIGAKGGIVKRCSGCRDV